MKFVKLTTNYTKEEEEDINNLVDDFSMQNLEKLYSTFEHVKFYSKEQTASLYAIVDDKTIEALFSEYIKFNTIVKYEDMSKSVLFGHIPDIEGKYSKIELENMINSFIENNLSVDVVLDKMNEVGLSKLSERDMKILETH